MVGIAGPPVAIWTVGISCPAWARGAAVALGNAGAAATGAVITATLMFSTVSFPYMPWKTALTPVFLACSSTSITTRIGRNRKTCLATQRIDAGGPRRRWLQISAWRP